MNESARVVPVRGKATRKAFVYRHVVSFEETNLVGNVYFARHVAWQGRCREMFLHQHAPGTLDDLMRDLRLITIRTTCDYYEELVAFDEVVIEMRLDFMRANRIGLNFDYTRRRGNSEYHAATGFQEIGCFTLSGATLSPCAVPSALAMALRPFALSNSDQIAQVVAHTPRTNLPS